MTISSPASTTINDTNKYAYGANIGWVNWQADTNNGAVVGAHYLTGYVYSANCGWISLGNGPTNGYAYSNASADDWGVNHDGAGNLSGYAYGANIGWINFETNGAPFINFKSCAFSGYAYGANVGWISLSNDFAFVQTDSMDHGPDSDGDGIADPWELEQVGDLGTLSNTNDHDMDGVRDDHEYIADTNPDDINEYFRATTIQAIDGGSNAVVKWMSKPTRLYEIDKTVSPMDREGWVDADYGPEVGHANMSTGTVMGVETQNYLRVRALLPFWP